MSVGMLSSAQSARVDAAAYLSKRLPLTRTTDLPSGNDKTSSQFVAKTRT